MPTAATIRRLEEVEDVSLADRAREAIRTAILDDSLHPGERLTIEQLAADLGVSRTPVREALKALEGDGLVRLIPHRGVIIEPLAREEIHHRYAIRAMLEGYAAELACRADAPGIAALLETNCAELARVAAERRRDKGDQTRRLSELNQDFHRVIREGSRSPTLIRLLGSLTNPLAFTLAFWSDPKHREASLEIHRRIADAFRRGKPELARRLTERHLLEARDALLAEGP
jgi:GntR family transcriptional regulator, vanillate catabolism transcriptional regulator